ncbi:TPA: hypothetical protein U1V46_000168 [Streptococcus suis]|nr:hypothetical protein [Streptococcus suis]HEM3980780.1 hypothetical protein [Streptococcus suis]
MSTSLSMEKFSDHIIAVAQQNNREITNLKLQKVMYFTLKYAIENEIFTDKQLKELYNEPFLVWAYGPVVKSQYDRFKRFGSAPILGVFKSEDTLNNLNSNILQNLLRTASELVSESHKVLFWKQNKNKIIGFRSDVAYTLGDI